MEDGVNKMFSTVSRDRPPVEDMPQRFEPSKRFVIENVLLSLCPQLRRRKYFRCIHGRTAVCSDAVNKGNGVGSRRKYAICEDCSINSRCLREQLDTFARNRVKDNASPAGTSAPFNPLPALFKSDSYRGAGLV
jgi:hypothetical protein